MVGQIVARIGRAPHSRLHQCDSIGRRRRRWARRRWRRRRRRRRWRRGRQRRRARRRRRRRRRPRSLARGKRGKPGRRHHAVARALKIVQAVAHLLAFARHIGAWIEVNIPKRERIAGDALQGASIGHRKLKGGGGERVVVKKLLEAICRRLVVVVKLLAHPRVDNGEALVALARALARLGELVKRRLPRWQRWGLGGCGGTVDALVNVVANPCLGIDLTIVELVGRVRATIRMVAQVPNGHIFAIVVVAALRIGGFQTGGFQFVEGCHAASRRARRRRGRRRRRRRRGRVGRKPIGCIGRKSWRRRRRGSKGRRRAEIVNGMLVALVAHNAGGSTNARTPMGLAPHVAVQKGRVDVAGNILSDEGNKAFAIGIALVCAEFQSANFTTIRLFFFHTKGAGAVDGIGLLLAKACGGVAGHADGGKGMKHMFGAVAARPVPLANGPCGHGGKLTKGSVGRRPSLATSTVKISEGVL
jgi:hypothetical protein